MDIFAASLFGGRYHQQPLKYKLSQTSFVILQLKSASYTIPMLIHTGSQIGLLILRYA